MLFINLGWLSHMQVHISYIHRSIFHTPTNIFVNLNPILKETLTQYSCLYIYSYLVLSLGGAKEVDGGWLCSCSSMAMESNLATNRLNLSAVFSVRHNLGSGGMIWLEEQFEERNTSGVSLKDDLKIESFAFAESLIESCLLMCCRLALDVEGIGFSSSSVSATVCLPTIFCNHNLIKLRLGMVLTPHTYFQPDAQKCSATKQKNSLLIINKIIQVQFL